MATPLRLSTPNVGAVDKERDTDAFVLSAVAGRIYQLSVTHGTLTDSQLRLIDQDGITELDFNDDRSPSSTEAELFYRANSEGLVFVELSGFGTSTGTYQLITQEVQDDHGHLTSDATAIELDGTVSSNSGNLFDQDIDTFSFLAQRNVFYRIETNLSSLGDSMLRLLNSGERELARNDDSSADTLASTLIWQAPQDDRYFIEVSSVGNRFGDYTLLLQPISDPVDDVGNRDELSTDLIIGTSLVGTLNYQGDEDWFRFEAVEDATYVFDVGLETLQDSVLRVVDGDGRTVLAENDDIEYPDRSSNIEWHSPDVGTKYVVVSGFDGHTGSYALHSEVESSIRLPGDLDMNGVVDAADIDRFFSLVREGMGEPSYDLNHDAEVDSLDSCLFVKDVVRTLLGDTNLDRRVDFNDFLVISRNFNRVGRWHTGDVNGDGWVGFDDFLLLSANFGLEA